MHLLKVSSHYKVSVIVTTYNWPIALALVLDSLLAQSVKPYEIIVADDGSRAETCELIRAYQDKSIEVPIIHMFHADKGFRAAKARNRAVALASGDYLLFLDGDCITRTDFIKNHIKLIEPGWFVTGNRLLLSEEFTKQLSTLPRMAKLPKAFDLKRFSFWDFVRLKKSKGCNRLLPIIHLPLGPFRKLFPLKWEGVKTCNLGVFKEDFVKVNGFNEAFEGWGYEDSDLVIRLQRIGISRKEGRFSVAVIHLWHKENDRSQEALNMKRLEASRTAPIYIERGLSQHLKTITLNQQEGWADD